jgi:hypothetical protein
VYVYEYIKELAAEHCGRALRQSPAAEPCLIP